MKLKKKPKIVADMARAFTRYMMKFKSAPVFRMSMARYPELTALSGEYAENVHIACLDESGGDGTVFGVPLTILPGKFKEIYAVDPALSSASLKELL